LSCTFTIIGLILLLLLLLLSQDHDKLGKQGDIVTVKAGHARYTLFPQGIADYAIPSVLRDMKVGTEPAAAAAAAFKTQVTLFSRTRAIVAVMRNYFVTSRARQADV
jgi:ribosomal protein L9